ncbi:MAG TPA: amidohydrolase family protein [Oscillatoriaceae cyanobacterium]
MCQGLTWNMPLPMPALDDAEASAVPAGLYVFDAHVHLFPPRVFEAIWRWFGTNAWPIRYTLYAEQTIAFLRDRGVQRMIGLHYAHTPGMARALNRFAAELARYPEVIPFGTVLPGEPEAEAIVTEAFEELGLRGLKLHCHVQQFAPDDRRLDPIYALCARHNRPIVIHSGREPSLPAYKADIHSLCAVDRVRRVLERHPDVTIVVPHLGADEIVGYAELLAEFPNLWLDTTMMLADYFPQKPARELFEVWGHRLLYGSDFPNLPYAWDRELKHLVAMGLPAETTAAIAGRNADRLFGVSDIC